VIRDFRDFILRGNVVDLAVGIVMGVAFGALVNSFVTNLVMTPIAAIVGKPNFDALVAGPFHYGAFLTALVQFLLIAASVFFFLVRPMNHLMTRFGLLKEPPQMRDCPACLQSVPAAATKCMYCTVDLTPEMQPTSPVR
jgi:large conductance mechanosensitive channel